MRVFHLLRPKELVLLRTVRPEPGEGEVLARVAVALTCGTDLKTYERGHPRLKVPGPLGHEWAGSVESVGPGVQNFRPGDRIVATPTAPCGDCAFCARLEENLCLHLFEQMAIGAYGDFLLLPRHIVNRNAFRIPAGVSDIAAAFLEPLACVVHGADRLKLSGDRSVVLLGDGPMALLFVQVARLRGAGRVVLVGRNTQRLQVARQLGTDFVIDARDTDVRTALDAITDGVGADTIVECVGRPEAWEEAVRLVRRGGAVLFFGGCERGSIVKLDTESAHYDEIAMMGAFHYTPASVRRAWELIQSGALKLDPLVSDRLSLEDLEEAFERVQRREAVKLAIVP